MRDADIGTFLLHPRIHPHFATELLVNCSWECGFRKFVRHGTPEDKSPAHGAGIHLDRDADVEAAANPRIRMKNSAGDLLVKPQMMSRQVFKSLSLIPELLEEGLSRRDVSQLVYDILISFSSSLVRDMAALELASNCRHLSEMGGISVDSCNETIAITE